MLPMARNVSGITGNREMAVGIGLLGFWLLVVVGPDCAKGELLRSCEQTVPAEQDWHGYERTPIPARAGHWPWYDIDVLIKINVCVL